MRRPRRTLLPWLPGHCAARLTDDPTDGQSANTLGPPCHRRRCCIYRASTTPYVVFLRRCSRCPPALLFYDLHIVIGVQLTHAPPFPLRCRTDMAQLYQYDDVITSPPGWVRSIVLSMPCLYVCLSVRSHNSKTARPNFNQFLCVLPMAVARSFFGSLATRYVLPVLWMTLCFHLTAIWLASRVFQSGDMIWQA